MNLRRLFRNPFSFLTATDNQEERVAAYVIREHDRGRSLAEILEDPYVRNRLNERERGKLMERPDVIRALGDDMVEARLQPPAESQS